ncbi:alpha/beta fold hydrolase [Simiduia sp. 21SJ11W-1]|uniref:alpha/beta hydrolase n=1 Tax=Simiduia sp. 21SJ11W-1 TaxID=2909669 RepID=UPI00209FA402|nr:alpha/beta hydrolase [Simiduia sp. 21SJ11W-1]UTA49119.1 alpha/beta fold hydrolase [Simiduia sp. 21SJ11W-1]
MRQLILFTLLILTSITTQALEAPPLQMAALKNLTLESGGVLKQAKLGYRTAGKLNAAGDNAILYPTWFGGSSKDMFNYGAIDPIDTSKYFVIVVDAFGNGVSASPSNHKNFPAITIGDMVQAQHQLLTKTLGITQLYAVVGTSMGGMQAFEWITRHPTFMRKAISLVGSPRLDTYDRLLWQTQLEAIALAEKAGDIQAANKVVAMIDALALFTPEYHARRTPVSQAQAFIHTTQTSDKRDLRDKAAQLEAMLSHDISRNFDGSMAKAAAAVMAQVLSIVDLQDHMVTPRPAIRFSELLGAKTLELNTYCGHISSACAGDEINQAVRNFLAAP